MIGMDVKVVFRDGSEHLAPITYAVACAWEDHHPGQAAAQMFNPVKFKQISYLAYEACRKANITVKVWPQFLDTVADIEIVPKEHKDEQGITQT
jgi:predicted solute-binding protein